MIQNSTNLIHNIGDESSARIGKVRRDEKMAVGTEILHPDDVVKKSKQKKIVLCDDELYVSCVDYLRHIGKEVCHNPDSGEATKCSCLMELLEDDNMTSTAGILLRVHSRRNDEVKKEFIQEWERCAAVSFLFEQNRKKRKNNKKKFKGERKRGRVYTLSAVYHEDGTAYKVCRNAFMKFFGIGRCAFKNIEKSVKEGNIVPTLHKLIEKKGNSAMCAEIQNSLTIFLMKWQQWQNLMLQRL